MSDPTLAAIMQFLKEQGAAQVAAQTERDRLHAVALEERDRRQVAAQEERDRLHAVALEERDRRQAAALEERDRLQATMAERLGVIKNRMISLEAQLEKPYSPSSVA